MNKESVNVEQEEGLPIPLSLKDLDTVMGYYSSPRAVTWDRDEYFKAVFQTAKDALEQNAALINQLNALKVDCEKFRQEVDAQIDVNNRLGDQLEEVKGKLVMLGDALEGIRPIAEACQVHEFNGKYPGKTVYGFNGVNLTFDALNLVLKVCKALSPDIQRYREEIEREAYEQAIKDAIAVISKGYFHLIGTGTMTEALESLLPNQKEVSNAETYS